MIVARVSSWAAPSHGHQSASDPPATREGGPRRNPQPAAAELAQELPALPVGGDTAGPTAAAHIISRAGDRPRVGRDDAGRTQRVPMISVGVVVVAVCLVVSP